MPANFLFLFLFLKLIHKGNVIGSNDRGIVAVFPDPGI